MIGEEEEEDSSLCFTDGLVAADFETSFSDLSSRGVTPCSTPQSAFKLPRPAVAVFRCDREICGRVYKTPRGLKSHLKLHNIRDSSARALSHEDIAYKAIEIGRVVVQRIAERDSFDLYGETFQELCKDTLLNEDSIEWLNLVEEATLHVLQCLPTKFNLPSSIRSEFNTKVQNLLANRDLRSLLVEKHSALGITPTEESQCVVWLFLGQFVIQFANEVLLLVLRSMRKPVEEESSTGHQQNVSLGQEQLYHYIAGWLVKDCIRRGLRYQDNNSKWSRILACIRACFVQSDTVEGPHSEFTKWTEAVDRGGLTNVEKLAHEFFMSLGLIAAGMEKLTPTDFFKQVYLSPRLVPLWDKIVGGALPAAESTWLMESMCKKFYNMYGKGRSNKERNEHLRQGHAHVSTRQRLARQ